MIRRRVVLVAALLVLFALGWVAGRGSARAGDLYQNLDLFVEILHRVQQNYVDPVEPQALVQGALKGMLRDLDPYSQYLDSRAYQDLQAMTQGSFGGIGVEVGIRENRPTVISPIEGGPAWALGVRSGDVITRIEGQATMGLSIEDVATLLRGPEGTQVHISVRREGENDQVDYTVERKRILTRSVRYAFVVDRNVGYLRLADFSEASGREVRKALEDLKQKGANRLVLDLRGNPGGLLDQAVDVAEQFVKSGTFIVATRGRAQGQDNRFYASEAHPFLDWPMVVLVDNASASASEIVAGSLQDLDRALLAGNTTFGKGSVQSLYPLPGKTAALKLTTGYYFIPSGRSIHRPRGHVGQLEAELDDDAPRDTVAGPDSVARMYRTAAGRSVRGGGGIRPDLNVTPDSLPPLTDRVEGRGLPFRFANRWINTHPDWKAEQPPTPALWKDFAAFLTDEKIPFTESELAGERTTLDRALRRELARRLEGDAAAARIALEGDPVFAGALQVLGRARSPRDVFAAALDSSAPRREPATPR